MKYGSWLLACTIAVAVSGAQTASAQGVGFLTEQQRLASYCAGVSESRMRELGDFIKNQCTASRRKECADASAELDHAKAMDSRLWSYLMAQIFATKEQGPRERALAQRAMSKGSDDWESCRRRPPGQSADDLQVCRDSRGCLIDARFSFLPP